MNVKATLEEHQYPVSIGITIIIPLDMLDLVNKSHHYSLFILAAIYLILTANIIQIDLFSHTDIRSTYYSNQAARK